MNALAPSLDLAPALVVLPGPRAAVCDGARARSVRPPEARELFEAGPVLVAHAGLTARRLELHAPPRSARHLRRAGAVRLRAAGRVLRALGGRAGAGARPAGAARRGRAGGGAARRSARALLAELAAAPGAEPRGGAGAGRDAGPRRLGLGAGGRSARCARRPLGRPWRGSGLDVWSRLPEWEDQAPPGEPGSKPIDPDAARARLAALLEPRRARRGAADAGRVRRRGRLRLPARATRRASRG